LTIGHFAVRYYPFGFLFDSKGQVVVGGDILYIVGMMNSSLYRYMAALIMPSMEYKCGHVAKLPFLAASPEVVKRSTIAAIDIAKADWDSLERSWEFQANPLISGENRGSTIEGSLKRWAICCDSRQALLRAAEAEINRLFIEAYALQDELSPDVPDDQITLYRPEREEDIKRLISYVVGCVMGRYNVEKPGLIYAHAGNKGFNPSQYKTFPPDRDGIVPLTDFEWFDNDTAKRFEEFIATAWPKEHLEENLKFVADSLGPKPGESSRATIRRYLAAGFYKHHLSQKMYKNRPIYWLFSSGKQRAFQALVYLHRYNEGTLSRMRTEYVVPLLGKISARIGQLDRDITGATGKHRRDLEKEQATLRKQLAELQEYDDKLRNFTDQRIVLDLDDGVKVNYAKFGDLLAEVKAVTGGNDDE
jgi:hypothetical protein